MGSRCPDTMFLLKLLLLCSGLLWSLPGDAAPVAHDGMAVSPVAQKTDHCLLILDTQADVNSFKQDMKRQKASFKERHRMVVEELKLIAEVTQPAVIDELENLQRNGAVLSFRPFFVSNIIAVECLPSIRPYLEQIPGVRRVENDEPLVFVEPVDNEEVPRDPHVTLDDPNGLYQIRANKVWELNISGNGVLLANIDTGVDGNHPALAQHWQGSLGDPPEQCWLDMVAPILPTPNGLISHGTQTMGIMCGMEPGDTVGVAWGATFIAAEISISGAQLTSHALEALEWMLDPDGNPVTSDDVPRIISNSWGVQAGTDPCSDTFYSAMDNCEAAGIALVWAAGNDGPGMQTIRKPANRADTPYGAFAVGNYNYITNDVDVESSRGPSPCSSDPELRIKPDVIAPGKNVRSTLLNGGYGLGSGTSYSAPHVAGTMALMLDAANGYLDPDSLKELIALTAVDMNDWGNDNNSGHGRLDAYFAVYAALTGIGWVEGVISDELGLPVQAEIYLPEHPHRFVSDEEGYFCFAVPAWMPFEIQVVVPTQEVYTEWLQVNPGDTTAHDINLVESLNGTLTGTVIDCQGLPATDALVEIVNAAVPDRYTDANGRFLFSLPAGFYHVRASSPECGQTVENNVQVITAGVTDIEIVLPLNPNFSCSDPDGYGYYVCDGNDPDGPIFDWTGLAAEEGGNGVPLNLYDDSSDEIILPFSVNYYGEEYDRIWINANGNISFGQDIYNYFNEPLPLMIAPAIFGLWDDFNDTIDGPGGSILARYVPEAAMFVVEWYQVPRYRYDIYDEGRGTFQIRIYDSEVVQTISGNTVFEVMYGDIDSTESATIGLDAANGTDFLPYVYNGQYELHASPIANGLAVRFADSGILNSSPSLSIEPPVFEVSLQTGESIDTVITLMNYGSDPLGYRVSVNEELYEGGGTSSKDVPAKSFGSFQASAPKGEVFIPPKGYEPVRIPRSSTLDEGGPDGFGYYWIDSRDAGGPAFDFTDISLIGVPIAVTGDDTTSENIELPWEFEFYDQRFRSLTVNSNGFITFWTIYQGAATIPLDEEPMREPFYVISAFWRDLDPSAGGSIETHYDEATDRFIIQWTDIIRFGNPGSGSTFQVVLHADGTIDLVYDHVGTNSAYCIIGIKGGHPGHALPIYYGQNAVDDDMMLRIYLPDEETANCRILDNSYGVIPSGDEIDIPIRITNSEQYNGSLSWPLTIKTTDPMQPASVVDVYMITPGEIEADLTVSKVDENIVLNWKPFPTQYYCIYSGGPDENDVTHFEGMTADTFFTLPGPIEEARLYAIRLCTASAAGQEAE